jgi:transcription initiation factor TFIIIB Brf1 subunit/transcription initiation factor TFIIB
MDVGDELVCLGCGRVKGKSVLEGGSSPLGKLPLLGRQPLGSYMGSKEITREERTSKVSGEHSSYERMKIMSDYAGRGDTPTDCARFIERVGEKLFLPRMVILQAADIAKRILTSPHEGRRLTVDVSAYSLIAACKIEGVTSVSVREVLSAHAALGRPVTSSSLFRIAFDSPVKSFARSPEDYVQRIVAKLSMNRKLAERLLRDGARASVYLESLRRLAQEVLGLCDRVSLAGKRPCALAASAVYSAEVVMSRRESRRPRLTQRECAVCGDTAEYTIREQCRTLFRTPMAKLSSRRTQTLLARNER